MKIDVEKIERFLLEIKARHYEIEGLLSKRFLRSHLGRAGHAVQTRIDLWEFDLT